MRGRLGMMVGFAAGYVLGAQAGRERYEQIRDQFNQLMGTEPAQQLQAQVRTAAETAGTLIEEKASEGMAKVSEKVAEKTGNLGSSQNETSAPQTARVGGGSGTGDTPGDITLPDV